jgi:hypothetical protein
MTQSERDTAGEIAEIVRSWGRGQAAVIGMIHSNRELLEDAGAWNDIQRSLTEVAEAYFTAILPLVLEHPVADLSSLQAKILALAEPYADFHIADKAPMGDVNAS